MLQRCYYLGAEPHATIDPGLAVDEDHLTALYQSGHGQHHRHSDRTALGSANGPVDVDALTTKVAVHLVPQVDHDCDAMPLEEGCLALIRPTQEVGSLVQLTRQYLVQPATVGAADTGRVRRRCIGCHSSFLLFP